MDAQPNAPVTPEVPQAPTTTPSVGEQVVKPHPEPMPPMVENPDLPDTQKWFRNRLVIFLIALPILAGVAAFAYQQYTKPVIDNDAFVIETDPVDLPATDPEDRDSEPQNISVHTFKGAVDAVKNDCIFDGECAVSVDGKWIVTSAGLSPVDGTSEFGGIVNAQGEAYTEPLDSLVGKNVEVFVASLDDERFTLAGSSEFYIKVLDSTPSSTEQIPPDASGEAEVASESGESSI